MNKFLLFVIITGVLTACTVDEATIQEVPIQEVSDSHYEPFTEEEVLEMWKTATLIERKEDDNWVREWYSIDGGQLAIELIEINHYLENKEYYDSKKYP